MANGDKMSSQVMIPIVSKALKTTLVGGVGMLVYDITANKLSVKTNAATAIGSWELITSAADA
jgi:hypothetical protein